MTELTLTKDHEYFLGTHRIEGVSEVLGATGLKRENPGSSEWYLDRGKAIHKATELYDIGLLDEKTLDERIKGYVQSWKRLARTYKKEDIEVKLYDKFYRYAGTLDRVDCDIKSGGPEPWHILQAAAYWNLRGGGLGLFHNVYLKEDGSMPTIKQYTYMELKRALHTFLCALNVMRARKELYH